MHRLLERQLKKFCGAADCLPESMRSFVEAIDAAYVQADEDRAMTERSMELSSHELLARNKELAAAERKYRDIFENVTEGICQARPGDRFSSVNPAMARICGYDSPEHLMTAVTDIATQLYVDPQRRAAVFEELERNGRVLNSESQFRRADGTLIWVSQNIRAVRDAEGKTEYYEGTVSDITDRKRSEVEREEMQSQLVTISRQAGMAEVATGVLHNVGNVLNSINVSASLTSDRVRASKSPRVAEIAAMLRDRHADLGLFLTDDEKGKQIPEYLARLGASLSSEKNDILAELTLLAQNIEHVKEIVTTQQRYAKYKGAGENVLLPAVIEDALRVNVESFERHRLTVVREFGPLPPAKIDKHQVLQILINLISNAKHAMSKSDGERKLTLRTGISATDPTRFLIEVRDTGMGIPRENFTRIFSHGFTTRPDGHGFGLHTSAVAAQSMKGSLTVHSDGPGTGATFTLELPLIMDAEAVAARNAA